MPRLPISARTISHRPFADGSPRRASGGADSGWDVFSVTDDASAVAWLAPVAPATMRLTVWCGRPLDPEQPSPADSGPEAASDRSAVHIATLKPSRADIEGSRGSLTLVEDRADDAPVAPHTENMRSKMRITACRGRGRPLTSSS
jgi:hypothetical protein